MIGEQCVLGTYISLYCPVLEHNYFSQGCTTSGILSLLSLLYTLDIVHKESLHRSQTSRTLIPPSAHNTFKCWQAIASDSHHPSDLVTQSKMVTGSFILSLHHNNAIDPPALKDIQKHYNQSRWSRRVTCTVCWVPRTVDVFLVINNNCIIKQYVTIQPSYTTVQQQQQQW